MSDDIFIDVSQEELLAAFIELASIQQDLIRALGQTQPQGLAALMTPLGGATTSAPPRQTLDTRDLALRSQRLLHSLLAKVQGSVAMEGRDE